LPARVAAARKSAKRPGKTARGKAPPHVTILVGTRKGTFTYHGDSSRKQWTLDGPHFLGHIINHFVLDPRDNPTMLIASKTGPSTSAQVMPPSVLRKRPSAGPILQA